MGRMFGKCFHCRDFQATVVRHLRGDVLTSGRVVDDIFKRNTKFSGIDISVHFVHK